MKIPFHCERCLLFVEFEDEGPKGRHYPEGWDVVQQKPGSFRFDWHCAQCLREIANGSPRVL